MKRDQYRALRRQLRRRLGESPPPAADRWRQPLAYGHWLHSCVEAQAKLDAINGTAGCSRFPTERQHRITVLARAQARRNAQRAALKALREAGADESEIRHADFVMRFYNHDPRGYQRRAQELQELRA